MKCDLLFSRPTKGGKGNDEFNKNSVKFGKLDGRDSRGDDSHIPVSRLDSLEGGIAGARGKRTCLLPSALSKSTTVVKMRVGSGRKGL